MRYSVVIPCWNRSLDLRRALESCMSEADLEFEIIVVDDASTEDIHHVCAGFGDVRIRYFRNQKNIGVAASRNVGIRHARGQYLLFLDSDDEYLPGKLARVDAYIAASGKAGVMFHAQWRVLSDRTRSKIPVRPPRYQEPLADFILINGNHVQTNTYVIRRDIVEKVQFDEECKLFEDTKFIIQCAAAAGGYAYLDEIWSVYYDEKSDARLSKLIDETAMARFLSFVKDECSSFAYAGLYALICGYIPFWRAPVDVVRGLSSGYCSGVSKKRIALYLARSMFGAKNINRTVMRLRQ